MHGAFLLALLLLVPASSVDRKAYQKDVEFLLKELENTSGQFFKRKKIDWKKVEKRFRKEVKKVQDDVEHFELVSRLVASVKDGHAGVVGVHFDWPEDRKQPQQKGIGMSLCIDGKKVYVKDCYGPAAAAGIQSGWEVKKIDKLPATEWLERRAEQLADRDGFSTWHAALYAACHRGLADRVGTSFSFELKKGKRGSAKKTLSCASGGGNGVPFGPVFPPKDAKQLGRHSYGKLDSGLGYIHLRKINSDLPENLDQMLGELGDVKGLVLDFRANTGGSVDHMAVVSRFLAPGQAFGPFKGEEGGEHYTGPMVVIVDAGTASAAETVSGYLKESRRAFMIGPTPTAGMSGSKKELDLPSGLLTVRVTVSSYTSAKGSGGAEIEGVGVAPDEVVPFDPEALMKGIDPLIQRAEQLLENGFPQGTVRYEAK